MVLLIKLLCCTILISSCTTVPKRAVMQAQYYFKQGDYTKAFNYYSFAASYYDPAGEYGIGYMYYYGIGVRQNEAKGIHWIRRAAEGHYSPAIKAQELIQENSSSIAQKIH